jgi:hypothetical protein
MRVVSTIGLIVAVLASTTTVSATDGAQRRNPYASLFAGQLNGAPKPQTPPAAPQFTLPPMAPTQTVVCGMTVVQGDAKIDPAMPHHPPANAPTPARKMVPASVCRK